MARQSGIILVRGKIGNIVGMRNGYGTTAPAFARELVTDPSNPQTDRQLGQRAKLLPAVLFRRQLESVISRAWEGTKYGGPSMREFMRYALRAPWSDVPQLDKDSTLPIPGQYLISKGSLPSIGYSFESGSNAILTSIRVGDLVLTDTTTIGDLSQAILDNNAGMRTGDQLTFVRSDADAEIITYIVYTVSSIIIDPNNTSLLTDILSNDRWPLRVSNGVLLILAALTVPSYLLGCGIVLSREGASSAQRSTQRFAVKKSNLAGYFADALDPAIADTYRTAQGSANLDWPYEDSDTGTVPARCIITVGISPVGAGTVTGEGTYTEGDTVVLSATTQSGSFSGWYDGDTLLSSDNPYTFVASRSMSITAVWEDRP